MGTQIEFKSGVPQTFTATRSFALGALNVTVAKGSSLSFDGAMVEYAGMKYSFPQLRSAVTAEWLVLDSDYDVDNPTYDKPVSANIKVRPTTDDKQAKPFKTTVTETDERVVMSYSEHASTTKAQNKAQGKEHKKGFDVIEDQEGVPIRSLKTAAKAEKVELTSESAGSAIRSAGNVQIDPGQGITEEEMLERMSLEDRTVYLAKKNSLKSRYIDTVESPRSVATVKTVQVEEKEGIKITQKVGGGVEIADMSGMGGKAKESTLMEDGIVFRNTNGPERVKVESHPRSVKQSVMFQDGTVDARINIARSLCPDFPDSYDFSAPSKKKLARLQADFEDRPDMLKAVFACESDDFKVKLVDEFPEVFRH